MCGYMWLGGIYVSPDLDSLCVLSVTSYDYFLSYIVVCATIPLDVLVFSVPYYSYTVVPIGGPVVVQVCVMV